MRTCELNWMKKKWQAQWRGWYIAWVLHMGEVHLMKTQAFWDVFRDSVVRGMLEYPFQWTVVC